MTTATATSIRVPVRTWREKAILAAAISSPLSGLWEAFDGRVGFSYDCLLDPEATDRCIDGYFESRPQIRITESVLRELRRTVPGPDVALEVPPELDIVKRLTDEVDHLVETDADRLLCKAPSRREIAEAQIVAIDLVHEVVGGDA